MARSYRQMVCGGATIMGWVTVLYDKRGNEVGSQTYDSKSDYKPTQELMWMVRPCRYAVIQN